MPNQTITTDNIFDMIHQIRGEKVLLDFDLAMLYGVETKRLKEAVRHNISRFPGDFMFVLTKEELTNLRTKISSSSSGGLRYPPFAFTEHGVSMLSGVLKSKKAIEINIGIIRAFVELRKIASFIFLHSKMQFCMNKNMSIRI